MTTAYPQISLFLQKTCQISYDLTKIKTVNINSNKVKQAAKEIAQEYFRNVRPILKDISVDQQMLSHLDTSLQKLNILASGNNANSSYKSCLRDIKKKTDNLELIIATVDGERSRKMREDAVPTDRTENSILDTLDSLVPTASLSYKQAIIDLRQDTRSSYRGVAAELREVLREVLDHLAPDSEVQKMANFKFEPNMDKPTHRQKAKFILSSRNLSKKTQNTPLNSLKAMDEIISSLARSVYERGSLFAHVGNTKQEAIQLKRYLDVVLCEFLQIP